MNKEILKYLRTFNLDVRKTHDARFMDQKVTPDVLCIIADCVLNFTNIANNIEFTTKDIWESEYANQNVKDIFNKPDVLTKTAKSEYDKFFQQPLKMLAYANILKCKKRRNQNYFKVVNRKLLEYISIKERNALDFLVQYLEKVLKDSGAWNLFEDFFLNNNKDKFNYLKNGFKKFLYDNTHIKQSNKYEPGRIFTKIINPLAFGKNLHGTKGGFFSPDTIGYDDLMYNRRNWRDVKKLRGETRQEHIKRAKKEVKKSRNAFINLTKEKIRRYHVGQSEFKDAYANGVATQVHHIFPKIDFPRLEAILENLILLTGTQHNAYAHPGNNTRLIDKNYQLACLLAKGVSVKNSQKKKDDFYSKDDFVYVLNEGISPENKFKKENSFREIEAKISDEYNKF